MIAPAGKRHRDVGRAGQQAESVGHRWRCFARLSRLLIAVSPRAMANVAAITLLIGVAPLLPLYVLRHLVDAAVRVPGTRGAGFTTVLGWTAAWLAAACLAKGMWSVGRLKRDEIQEALRARLQGRLIAKAQALPLAAFEEPDLYDQLQRIDRWLDEGFFSAVSSVFRAGNQVITLLALALFVGTTDWSLPVIMVGGTVLFALVRVRLWKAKYLLERAQTERERRLGYMAGLMTGRDAGAEVRLFDLREYLLRSWDNLRAELRDERLSLVRRDFRFEVASSSGQSFVFGSVLAVVVYLVARGTLTVGQYAAFIGAVQQFQDSVFDFVVTAVMVDKDLRYVSDLFVYLDLPEEERGTSHLPEAQLKQGIVFEMVEFRYPDCERLALDRLCFHIRPGERIALVGENGAGKTTLVKLLLGLYQPTAGRILVDGVDLRDLDPVSWRTRAAVVFQDFQQYQLTVSENIGLGNLDRLNDATAIECAARRAGAASFIATLPRGYGAQLGKAFEEGVELSHGQWQRIALSRAYLRDAELLVLDEPTAALDPKAEVEIYRQFRDASEGKTVLLISHRLGSARLADRILVLEAGCLAEQGPHAELMKGSGLYARMFATQAQWYA